MEMLRGLGMDPTTEAHWALEIPTLTPALMTPSLSLSLSNEMTSSPGVG